MIRSITNLIAVLSTAVGLLIANAASAKGPNNGGNNFSAKQFTSTNSVKHISPKQFITSTNSTSHISPKPILSGTLLNKNNNGNFKVTFGGNPPKKLDSMKSSKDFSKKDFHCYKDYCYWNHCSYPWYYGCYYPTYSCYDYSYPIYSSYTVASPIAVLPIAPATRTRVALGSMLMLNGQAFGDKPGGARLRISGMALPIEVVEWTPSAVKVRLPLVELAGVTPADIEVVRVDGSLASKTPVELTPPAEQLAIGQ
jgi:hypothetical protein